MIDNEYLYTYERVDAEKFDRMIEGFDKTKPVIIYGAGVYGLRIFVYLSLKEIPIKCFVDSDDEQWGDTHFFTKVISPAELKETYSDEPIIVTPYEYGEEIQDSLLNMGFDVRKIYLLPFNLYDGVIRLPDAEQHKPSDLDYAKTAMENPPITVLTLVYNSPEFYLRRSIESILRQTYRKFKYLIIDHASDDGTTAEILAEYVALDARVQVERAEENHCITLRKEKRRPMHLKNIIDAHIKTEYVCGLDADDYYEDNYLEVTYGYAREYNADAVSVPSTFYFQKSLYNCDIDETKGVFLRRNSLHSITQISKNEKEKIKHFFTSMQMLNWWGILAKRGIFINGLYYLWYSDSKYLNSDVFFAYKVMLDSKVVVFAKELLHVFSMKADSTAKTSRKSYEGISFFVSYAIKEILPDLRSKLEKNNLKENIYLCFFNGDIISCFIHILSTIQQNDYKGEDVIEIRECFDEIITDEYFVKFLNTKKKWRDAIEDFKLWLIKQNGEIK